jgi:glycosyltransferase involved in cell wall biosynthesis
MPAKVLHVSESNEWSGGAAQLLALAVGLRERGWDSRIGCRPGSGLFKHASERKLATFTVPLREDYDLPSAFKLARYVQDEGIDVVHAHHNRSHAVCLLANVILGLRGQRRVLVVSRRVSFPPGRNPFSRWKYTSGSIDRIVAVAGAIKDVLVAAGVPAEKVEVVHSGVDVSRYSIRPAKPELARALGLPEGVPVVGKIANASPWKGQNVLLEAAAKLLASGRKLHFLLAGRDTQGEWVKGEVARLGLEKHVTLAGFRADVPDLLPLLSVSVNSAVQGEGLSGALRESLTAGVPVVASDHAGNRELLKDGKGGWLFPAGDASALAERVGWVLDHPKEARESVTAWQKDALREFSIEATIEKTAALYERLLAERR